MSGILAKDRFLFDPADLSESDQVGAYLRAGSDGDLISSTNVGGKEGVDVNLINSSIAISGTDIDIRDLVFATDKVDVSGSEVSLDAGTLAALENITVSATNLDIRDLVFATDKVDVSGSEVSLSAGSLAALENITVSATDLDIRDLAFATDKVDVSGSEVSLDSATLAALENITATIGGIADDAADSGDVVKVGGVARAQSAALDLADAGDRVQLTQNLQRHVFVSDQATQAVLASAVTIGATAGALPASALANRKEIQIQNVSNNDIWIGHSGVTTANGIRVSKGSFYSAKVGEGVILYAIAAGAGNDVRVIEYA